MYVGSMFGPRGFIARQAIVICLARTAPEPELPAMLSRLDDALRRPLALMLLWGACVMALAVVARHFWIPIDEGTLAQSAERVLGGQLPHRDFGDPYTGLNAMIGAAAFRLLGVDLLSLRVPLVIGYAAWLPAVWLVARRFLTPTAAVGTALLAATSSVPAYPAAMPTWFGMFAVTWGLWCVLRAIEGGGRPWLVGAGAAAGVSVLFKITGLYFLAATLLALAWRRADGSRSYVAAVTLGAAILLALVGRLVLPGTGVPGAYHFFLPSLAVGAALVARASRSDAPGDTYRGSGIGALVLDGGAVVVGAVLPVLLFLVPYVTGGGVSALFRGVFVLPVRRLDDAAIRPGDAWMALPGIVAVTVAAVASTLEGAAARRGALALAVGAALIFALGHGSAIGLVPAYLWLSARAWVPALTVWGVVVLARAGGDAKGASAFAALASCALWVLVEFPYASWQYFFYAAPLAVLATVAVWGVRRATAGPVLGLLGVLFAYVGAAAAGVVVFSATTPLGVPRGQLRVPEADAELYRRVVGTVRTRAGDGALWAGPDAPEVYFLTDMPNPTRTLYEFLDPGPATPDDFSALFSRADVRVAVVRTRPTFSAPLDPDELARVVQTFPEGRTVGPFMIRWRSGERDR